GGMMTEPTPPLGEDESGFTDEELDAFDDSEPIKDMAAVRRLRSQAQRLRHRLREAEANRQAAEDARAGDLARLAEYEKREVERAAAQVLIDPEDLMRYTDEATQAEFNDEFGRIVADNVVAAAKRVIAERPHLAKPQAVEKPPTDRPLESLRGGAAPESKPKTPTWSSVLRGG